MKYALGAIGLAAAVVIAALSLAPQRAAAIPKYTEQTGKPCGFCHTKVPDLNDQGRAFQNNGRRL
jgi:hypothetical protein